MPSLCIYVTKAIMVTSQLFVSPLLKLASYAVRFRLCLPAAPNANVCCFTGSWLPGWVSLFISYDTHLPPTRIFPWREDPTRESKHHPQVAPQYPSLILRVGDLAAGCCSEEGEQSCQGQKEGLQKKTKRRKRMPRTNWTSPRLPLPPFLPLSSSGALECIKGQHPAHFQQERERSSPSRERKTTLSSQITLLCG